MKLRFGACLFGIVLFAACKKNGGSSAGEAAVAASKTVVEVPCGKEIVAVKPVKVGETGIMLPVGTKLCIPKDESEVRVELPADYTFSTKEQGKAAPFVFATYTCLCSQSGSTCQIFFAEGMGFGCLQSSCSGSCTGKFTYKGYTVDRVFYNGDKTAYFDQPEVQEQVIKMYASNDPRKPFVIGELPGVRFAMVNDEAKFLAAVTCDCDGTQACKLKVVNIPFIKAANGKIKIYYCDGGCNGCELTVD